MKRHQLIGLGSGVICAAAVTGALAQEAPSGSNVGQSAKQDSTMIEEIVVTAQRRKESSQTVPVSVTALSSQVLEKAGIVQTNDLQAVTPGLVWSTAISTPTPFIRGVGSRDNSAANENGVATYMDGFYYAAMPSGLLALPNIERVEVLKGPQGTLFGRNANGGLIQIITRDPPKNFAAKVKVGYANYDTFSGSAYIGGPIGSLVSADLSVYFTDQGQGWGHNLTNGADVNLAKDKAFRTKWVYQPTDLTKAVLAFDFDDRRSDIGSAVNIYRGTYAANGRCSAAPFPAGYPACAAQPSSTFQGSIYDTQSDLYGRSGKGGAQKAGTRQHGVSLMLEQDVGLAVLRSWSSYRHVLGEQYIDQEGSPELISSVTLRQQDNSYTQELQVASPSSSSLTWVVGAFYMNRQAQYDPFSAFGYSLGLASALDPAGRFGAPPAFAGGFNTDAKVTTDSLSEYAQATVEFLPKTHLTVGLRHTLDKNHLKASQIDFGNRVLSSSDVKKNFENMSYRAAIDHQFSSRAMVYASYNRGFKAGLFNTTNARGTFAGPETLDAYEVGAKTELLDRRLRFNVAAYHYDYNGLQLPVVVPGGTQTINAAKAKIDGVDIETIAKPFRGVTLTAGLSRLFTAKYTSFPNGPLFIPTATGNSQVAADLSDKRMIRSPKFSGNVGVDYAFETAVGEFGANATYYYTSGFYWTPDDVFEEPSHGLLNLQVQWTNPDARYKVQLWARNATNKEYLNYLGVSSLGTVTSPGEPRTYGISVHYNL